MSLIETLSDGFGRVFDTAVDVTVQRARIDVMEDHLIETPSGGLIYVDPTSGAFNPVVNPLQVAQGDRPQTRTTGATVATSSTATSAAISPMVKLAVGGVAALIALKALKVI